MRWNRRDIDGWHRWFAWYPVTIKDTDLGTVETVWFEKIERRALPHAGPNDPPYEYRNIDRSPY
ncbi:hypothetical protein UFOVP395_195 [uncultured Caudovirales phage]|jgi:hypothetical protein|uniref:Uncharacterized protein n=1 Tax=uncultured Caudovirales phage TaxID=2100421 RepID=A0A6J5M6Z5_9CAUD|nr:hypothetical protein UFOVP395_195 [uncultured Caudovirales phage]